VVVAGGEIKMSSALLQPSQCPAYILAGGHSTRFGSDKARVTIAGQPLLIHLHTLLQQSGHEVLVVADRTDRFADLGVECIADVEPECGPLAGLVAALGDRRARSGAGWILLMNCDQVHWDAKWFGRLAGSAREGSVAVAYRESDLQPIPALYHTGIQERAAASLSSRELSLKRLLMQLADRTVTVETDANPRDWSFNDPDQLAQLLAKR
jgi:molybdenum cofactor guanylyltransferase